MNGFLSNFMVYPVQMVAKTTKLKRENGRSGQRRSETSGKSHFRHFLEDAAGEDCTTECIVVTYNADRQLQTYHYRSREYTF